MILNILPYPFCGNQDIEPSLYDDDCYEDAEGNTVYDVRMIMNCDRCGTHMTAAGGIADSMDGAEDAARARLIRRWNMRWNQNGANPHDLV